MYELFAVFGQEVGVILERVFAIQFMLHSVGVLVDAVKNHLLLVSYL